MMGDMARINADNSKVPTFGNLIEYRYTVYNVGELNESEFLYNASKWQQNLLKNNYLEKWNSCKKSTALTLSCAHLCIFCSLKCYFMSDRLGFSLP